MMLIYFSLLLPVLRALCCHPPIHHAGELTFQDTAVNVTFHRSYNFGSRASPKTLKDNVGSLAALLN